MKTWQSVSLRLPRTWPTIAELVEAYIESVESHQFDSTQESIAQTLGISVRTYQRILKKRKKK